MKIYLKTYLLIIISFFSSSCNINSHDVSESKRLILVKQFDSIDSVYLKYPEIRPKSDRIVINKNEVQFYNSDKSIANTMLRKRDFDLDTSISFYGGEKKTDIRKRFFYESINEKLLIETSGLFGPRESTHQVRLLEKKVFDSSGTFITNIDPMHFIRMSSDNDYFVSFFEWEVGGDTLVIYNYKGDILCKHYASVEAHINFLPESNILSIIEPAKMNLTLLDPSCQKILSLDYMKELNIGYIATSFVLQPPKQVLLSSFSIVILYDMNSGEIWRINENIVQDCFSLKEKSELLLNVWDNRSKEKNNQYQVKLVNITNGDAIESLYADEVLFINESYFIIKKEGNYYEYVVN